MGEFFNCNVALKKKFQSSLCLSSSSSAWFKKNVGPSVKHKTIKICSTKEWTKKLKTYKEEKAGDCHYIRRKLLDSLSNLCWSVETHLPGSRSEWGEMARWAVTFSGSHLCRVTSSSSTGTGITLQHLVSFKFRASGKKMWSTLNIELTFKRGETTLAMKAQAVHLGSLWEIFFPLL